MPKGCTVSERGIFEVVGIRGECTTQQQPHACTPGPPTNADDGVGNVRCDVTVSCSSSPVYVGFDCVSVLLFVRE